MRFIEVSPDLFDADYRETNLLPAEHWRHAFVSPNGGRPTAEGWRTVTSWLREQWPCNNRGILAIPAVYATRWENTETHTVVVHFRDADAAFAFKMRWC